MASSENTRALAAELQFWIKHRHKTNIKQEEIENFVCAFLDNNNLDMVLQFNKKNNQVAALLKKSEQSSK
jgi:hypothetical protein